MRYTLGNVSRASEALHITQPALTRALQEFESQLGVLLRRTTCQVSLTHEGERLSPVAQCLLRDLDRPPPSCASRPVALAAGTAFACTVLLAVLKRFAIDYLGVRIKLLDDNSAGITARVAGAEAGLGMGSPVSDTSGLLYQRLLSAPVDLLADPCHFPIKASCACMRWSNWWLTSPSPTPFAVATAWQ